MEKKEYCAKCHLAFGLAEERVAVRNSVHVHVECYEKMLREVMHREDTSRQPPAQHLSV